MNSCIENVKSCFEIWDKIEIMIEIWDEIRFEIEIMKFWENGVIQPQP